MKCSSNLATKVVCSTVIAGPSLCHDAGADMWSLSYMLMSCASSLQHFDADYARMMHTHWQTILGNLMESAFFSGNNQLYPRTHTFWTQYFVLHIAQLGIKDHAVVYTLRCDHTYSFLPLVNTVPVRLRHQLNQLRIDSVILRDIKEGRVYCVCTADTKSKWNVHNHRQHPYSQHEPRPRSSLQQTLSKWRPRQHYKANLSTDPSRSWGLTQQK